MNSIYRHHKYRWSKPFGGARHSWEFVGPVGALSFNVGIHENYDPSCGLEYHHTFAPYGPAAPDHIDCPLTGGRCWHDGTSLYASEHVWPFVEPYLRIGDHETIFRFLEGEADRRFADYPGPYVNQSGEKA
jgi:hypothetical protein